MFARSVLRASTRAAAPSFTKAARASFTVGAKLRADPFNPQREVPTSSYADGEVQRSTITVGSGTPTSPEGIIPVKPLTAEIYNAMTPSMQKMTLYGKVVIVTG